MSYDEWLTNDPEDRDVCEMHGILKPCVECRIEKLEDMLLRYEREGE